MKKKAFIIGLLILTLSAVFLTGCIKKPDPDKKIDLSKFKLLFADEFDTFNTEVWSSKEDGVRRGGYWDINQVSVRDGNLVITTEYLEDGRFGAGWYSAGIVTMGTFEMREGYVEARCKLPAGQGQWGAVWLNSQDMKAGGAGTEIDIIEGAYYDDPDKSQKYKNTAFHTIHAEGYEEEHESETSPYYAVGNDIYENFNTYGVYFDKNGYKFYVNGMLTWETDFHPSSAPEFLFLSTEVAGENDSGNPSNPDNKYTWSGQITDNPGGNAFKSEFVIDYIRCYALK